MNKPQLNKNNEQVSFFFCFSLVFIIHNNTQHQLKPCKWNESENEHDGQAVNHLPCSLFRY